MRIAMAMALALLMLPVLGSSASAEGESADDVATADELNRAGDRPTPPLQEEPAADPELTDVSAPGVGGQPVAAPKAGEQKEESSGGDGSDDLLASSREDLEATAAQPGQCDTNVGTGAVSSFTQNTSEDSSGQWINGVLNQNNSNYAEGDWVPQRVELTQLHSGENELVFTYDLTNKEKFAYDKVGQESMSGGQITGWSLGDEAGPTVTVYVTFEVPEGTSSATLYFAAHIASELQHGPNSGAGSISGASYHISLSTLNCAAAGKMDNQLMAAAVDAGELTIVKQATPADGTDFGFAITPGGDASTFTLDVDSDPARADRATYRLAPGTYTIEEIDVPAGWTLTGLICAPTANVSVPAKAATVTIVDDMTATCTFTNTKVQYADLVVAKTAATSFDRDYDWTIEKTVSGDSQKFDADGAASFAYKVVVSPSAAQDTNFEVAGRITVTNPNAVPVTDVALSDQVGDRPCAIGSSGSNTPSSFTVPANGSLTFDYNCALPDGSPPASGTNTATVTWNPAGLHGTSGSASASADYDFTDATITVTDETVTVTDDQTDLAREPGGNTVTAPGVGTFEYRVEYTASDTGTCTPFVNTAAITDDGAVASDSATVHICKGADLQVSKNKTASLTRTYLWDVQKSTSTPRIETDPHTGTVNATYSVLVDSPGHADSAWQMTGEITVVNPNSWPVNLANVKDIYFGGGICSIDGTTNGETDRRVPAHGSVTFTYTCDFLAQPGYSGVNTATVEWDAAVAGTPLGTASGIANVTPDDWTQEPVNDTVTVVDDAAGQGTPITIGTFHITEAFPTTKEYTLRLPVVPGDCKNYENSVAVMGNGAKKLDSSSADVVVCAQLPLTVSKDAEASYDTRYLWKLEKAVSPSGTAYVDQGTSADFTYAVTAVPTGSEDSNWHLTGTITVSNPNSYGDAVTATLADVFDNGTPKDVDDDVTCAVTYPHGLDHLVVPNARSGGSASATYDCEFDEQPDYTGTNHVTVTWGNGEQTTGSAAVTFELDATIDETVTVYDDMTAPGQEPVPLGQATWAWDTENDRPESTVLPSYRLTQTGTAGRCTSYTNKAWIGLAGDGEVPEAEATVRVCVERPLTVRAGASASYHTTYLWDIEKSATPERAEILHGEGQDFDYTVTAIPTGSVDSLWRLTGTITVTNPNEYGEPIKATLVDTFDNGTPDNTRDDKTCAVSYPDGRGHLEIPSGGGATASYECAAFEERPSYSGTNNVTVIWGEGDAKTLQADGAPVEFTQETTTDKTVTVYDDKVALEDPEALGEATWAWNELTDQPVPTAFRYSLRQSGQPGQCTPYTNTAYLDIGVDEELAGLLAPGTELPNRPQAKKTVTLCVQAPLGVTKTAEATYDTRYMWDLVKTVNRTEARIAEGDTASFDYTVKALRLPDVDSNWKLTGSITVTNPNEFTPVEATLSDVYDNGTPSDAGDDVSCDVHYPDKGLDHVAVPAADGGGSVTVGYTCTFDEKPSYSGTNTVTVSYDADADSVTYRLPVRFTQAGTTDSTITVVDDKTDPDHPVVLGTATWDAGEADRSFTYTLSKSGAAGACTAYTNTASVDLAPGVHDLEAKQAVRVCVETPLEVRKDAEATYDTTYFWDIRKSVDQGRVEVVENDQANLHYTVVAEPTRSEDSNWQLSGTITVENPNTYDPVSVTLSDVFDNGSPEDADDDVTCDVSYPGGGTSLTVPAATTGDQGARNGTAVASYVCDLERPASYTATNTVTVHWGDGRTNSYDEPVVFERTGAYDETIKVYDDKASLDGLGALLGEASWHGSDETRTFSYDMAFAGEAGTCTPYTNTATAVLNANEPAAKDPTDETTTMVCVEKPMRVEKSVTAEYDRRHLWELEKDVDRAEVEVAEGEAATFQYTVRAKASGHEDSDHRVFGTIEATNPNDYKKVVVDVSDEIDLAGVGSCTVTGGAGLEIEAGGTRTVGYTCDAGAVAEADYETGENTATVTWTGPRGRDQVSDEEDVHFRLDHESDAEVTVVDDKTDPEAGPQTLGTVGWKEPGATFTYGLTKGGAAGTCTAYTNTATLQLAAEDLTDSVTVRVCVEDGLDVTKTAHASFNRTYHWLIDKSVDDGSIEVTEDGAATFDYTVKATPNGSSDSGYALGGTITVTNPNAYADGSITTTVTDAPMVGGGAVCTVTDGDSVTVAPGASTTLPYSCSFTSRPSNSGTNTATATWTGPDSKARTSATGAVPVTFIAAGHANSSVTVTDSMTTPSVLGTATWNTSGTPTTFAYSLTHQGTENTCVDFTNTARLTQTGQSDAQTVTVCDQGALVVTNTAEATYDRTYQWDIAKGADRTRLDTDDGQSGTVNYTVGVTPTGFVDSGWTMSGMVTVTNPNEYKDVTVSLTDVPAVGGGATCRFEESEGLLVEAGETRTFRYTCEFASQPAYDGSNTVLVGWGDGSVRATADVAFEAHATTNETITVADDMVRPSELGTVTWDADGETVEFGYAVQLEGQHNECETVTNTASIIETDQQAQADVLVCGPEILGVDEERPPVRPRPPAVVLPETGAPAGVGPLTMLGGLLLAVGALLMVRRRRDGA